MELPLRLKELPGGGFSYGIPLWYRLIMTAMFALIAAAIWVAGDAPGIAGWAVLALLALGALYEERWDADLKAHAVRHRAGLIVLGRRTLIPFGDIANFSLQAHARGTVPGGEEERKQAKAAFARMRGEAEEGEKAGMFARLGVRKPFIDLLLRTHDGTVYLVDTCPARRAARLQRAGDRLAFSCGVPFVEKEE